MKQFQNDRSHSDERRSNSRSVSRGNTVARHEQQKVFLGAVQLANLKKIKTHKRRESDTSAEPANNGQVNFLDEAPKPKIKMKPLDNDGLTQLV